MAERAYRKKEGVRRKRGKREEGGKEGGRGEKGKRRQRRRRKKERRKEKGRGRGKKRRKKTKPQQLPSGFEPRTFSMGGHYSTHHTTTYPKLVLVIPKVSGRMYIANLDFYMT